jgi:hypothetical protein
MTKVPWRIKIRVNVSWQVFKIHRARVRFWGFIAHLCCMPAEAVVSFSQRTRRRQLEALRRAADNLTERFTSLTPELQSLDRLTTYRKGQVLTARSALLKEYTHLLEFASKIESNRHLQRTSIKIG